LHYRGWNDHAANAVAVQSLRDKLAQATSDSDMTDDYDDSQQSEDASHPLASLLAGRPWLKPLLFFAIALATGALASGLWLRWHPKPATLAPSETVVASAPDHRPLPAPMAGGTTNLPESAAPAPGAPHIVSVASETARPQDADSLAADAIASPAEAAQEPTLPASEPSAADGDRGPQVIDRSQPAYPADALRVRAEGVVRLRVSLDPQGQVVGVSVAETSGTEALDFAALDAARNWHYKPAMRGGQAVAGILEVPVDFKLEAQNPEH
jgi:periplasmic protein TonB